MRSFCKRNGVISSCPDTIICLVLLFVWYYHLFGTNYLSGTITFLVLLLFVWYYYLFWYYYFFGTIVICLVLLFVVCAMLCFISVKWVLRPVVEKLVLATGIFNLTYLFGQLLEIRTFSLMSSILRCSFGRNE